MQFNITCFKGFTCYHQVEPEPHSIHTIFYDCCVTKTLDAIAVFDAQHMIQCVRYYVMGALVAANLDSTLPRVRFGSDDGSVAFLRLHDKTQWWEEATRKRFLTTPPPVEKRQSGASGHFRARFSILLKGFKIQSGQAWPMFQLKTILVAPPKVRAVKQEEDEDYCSLLEDGYNGS